MAQFYKLECNSVHGPKAYYTAVFRSVLVTNCTTELNNIKRIHLVLSEFSNIRFYYVGINPKPAVVNELTP